MQLKLKTSALIILGVVSILLSRSMFLFVNDPEGPNLLIVMVLAVGIYLVSLGIYLFLPLKTLTGPKKVLSIVSIQVLLVITFHFLLNLKL